MIENISKIRQNKTENPFSLQDPQSSKTERQYVPNASPIQP